MTRIEWIEGLRKVADFFEQHPEVMPLGWMRGGEFEACPETFNIPNQTKQQLSIAAKALGHADKVLTDSHFTIHGLVGGHAIDFYNTRESVCERVVVGTKVVPAHILPAREEMVIPESVQEVYEWKCPDSLLAGASK